MKAKMTLTLIILLVILIIGCKQNTQNQEVKEAKIDIINDEFPVAQTEIKEVVDGIFKSIQNKDAEKLYSFHMYSPKFTAFSPGILRQGSKENEESEKKFISTISSFDYNLNDLKINVFGEVAIVTYHGDFEYTIGEEIKQMHTQTTLIFIKIDNTWKITHEHSSPRNTDQKNNKDKLN